MNKFFTANYINADSNFAIFNLDNYEIEGKERSVICILLNILQRGCPTNPSQYLSKHIVCEKRKEQLHLLSCDAPDWGELIKGGEDSFPARTFLYEIIPQYFTEYPYLAQLFRPEVLINDILPKPDNSFVRQRVDFYLPQANIVVEIDGDQHKAYSQLKLDESRDKALAHAGISVIRITSKSIYERDENLINKLEIIRKGIEHNEEVFLEYDRSFRECKEIKGIETELKLICSIRLQIAILELLLSGAISLTDEKWFFNIKSHEVAGYEVAAINDLKKWLYRILILAGIERDLPRVFLVKHTDESSFLGNDNKCVKIEMSALTIATPENTKDNNTIYIYSTADRLSDFFKLSVADPIAYEFSDGDNENADVLNPKRRALKTIMKDLFEHDDFRPGQERIVINALKLRNTIGILPTGSGKSLCYQLSAMLQPGICMCVCPIKSLMIDQNDELNQIGISRTAFISSDLKPEERKEVQEKFNKGKYIITFMSPERFQDEKFREFLLGMKQTGIGQYSYATIDEVHCLSEWGHSFRVSYLNLVKTIRNYCHGAVIIGLTATASFRVIKNILLEFGMDDREDIISASSFDRKELVFEVEEINGRNKINALINRIDRYRHYYPDLLKPSEEDSRCGIIFTPHVNGDYGCDKVAYTLKNHYGADVRCYSGKPPDSFWGSSSEWDEVKRENQKDFKDNKYTLLAATKAFGMGINKPNIRYTIHYGIPESLEALYQEAGRAGRDKHKAQCLILYSKEQSRYADSLKMSLKSDNASVQDLKTVVRRIGFDGEDLSRQSFLFSKGLISLDDEIKCAEYIIDKIKNGKAIVHNNKSFNLDMIQKVTYHLSVIGVVNDWTVDWKAKALTIYANNYSLQSLKKKTLEHITAYEKEDEIEYLAILDAVKYHQFEIGILKVFLRWYYNSIVYSRKQALLNVDEACSIFAETNDSEGFRNRMEAYFKLDDIVDTIGEIADYPRDYERWFKIINKQCIDKNKASGIIMRLNRFLESYKHNTGLNYVSGILNMIDNSFDSINGRTKLEQALRVINTLKEDDREQILINTAAVIATVGDESVRALFASFFIEQYYLDDVERIIYKQLEDNYSLSIFMKKMIARLVEHIGA